MDIDIKHEKLRHFAESHSQGEKNIPPADVLRSEVFTFLTNILFWSTILFLISWIFVPTH